MIAAVMPTMCLEIVAPVAHATARISGTEPTALVVATSTTEIVIAQNAPLAASTILAVLFLVITTHTALETPTLLLVIKNMAASATVEITGTERIVQLVRGLTMEVLNLIVVSASTFSTPTMMVVN